MDALLNNLRYWWKVFGEWLLYNTNTQTLLFMFYVGVFLVLLAIFLPKKIVLYKIDLKRMFNRKVTDIPMSSTVKYLHGLTRTGIFRYFILDEDSDTYKRIEKIIIKAGGLNGCTPDIIHWFKIVLPSVTFAILTVLYMFSLTINYKNIADKVIGSNSTPTTGIVVMQSSQPPSFSFTVFMIIVIISIAMYYVPEKALDFYIKLRTQRLLDELPTIEMFMSIYLDAGYNVYDILTALSDVVVHSKKYIIECINEFYVSPEKALQNMADKIGLPEYQLVCDILKQAVNTSGKYASSFVKQHMEQINKLKELTNTAKLKRKPLLYVLILALPMLNVVLIWFYPWVVRVFKVTQFMNM